jgi:hypothetical protein
MATSSKNEVRPLTVAQIGYAGHRLHQIAGERIHAFERKLPLVEPDNSLSPEDKRKLIVAGKAKMRPASEVLQGITYFVDNFTYPRTAKQLAAEAQLKANKKARADFEAKVYAEEQALLAKLYFADAAEALAALEAFAKG